MYNMTTFIQKSVFNVRRQVSNAKQQSLMQQPNTQSQLKGQPGFVCGEDTEETLEELSVASEVKS